jgi:CubicO group peptidase (beta-lactamase class C family)
MLDAHFRAASPEEVGIDSERLEALFQRAAREVEDGLLPSAQIAVAREGKIAAMRTFGRVLHEGHPGAATDDTLYCVFSCTKAITSAAAWLLMQEGKLDPSERVADIVPEFDTHDKGTISVEQLMTHTAGFPHAPFSPPEFPDRAQRRRRFSEWRLNWAPGTRFEYHPSSSMYVLADIIERRADDDYRGFVRRRIAEPLGLRDLWVGLPRAEHARLADVEYVGEEPSDEEYARLGVPRPAVTEVTEDALKGFNQASWREAGVPGGGGTMTAADLALFYQALLTGRAHGGREIWRTETLAMARRIRTEDLKDLLYGVPSCRGLGLIISGDETRTLRGFGHPNSPEAFGHGGAGGQIAWVDPESGISVGYVTSGHDRNPLRRGRRGTGIASRAALCRLGDTRRMPAPTQAPSSGTPALRGGGMLPA